MLYTENSKDSTKKLLKLINEFRNVAEYEVNIHKSVEFLYANNKLIERETKKTILPTIASKHKIPRNKPNQGCKRPVLRK